MIIKLVVATRFSEADFYEKSATGKSLKKFMPDFIELNLYSENTDGLSKLYNRSIYQPEDDNVIMVFMHDDVHLLDYFWFYRIQEGLQNFDVIGLVGNKSRQFQQPSWAFKNSKMELDDFKNFSGVIAHGKDQGTSKIDFLGQTRQQVKLIDGVLIGVKRKNLIDNNLFFDENFDFDFYDMDFCRQAELKGLKIGTWDIAVMHESGGNYSSPNWSRSYQNYVAKWGD